MPRKVHESVVVITGASSGIGRATALEFARRGASVVLAARREQPLQELAAQCETLGGHALAVPTDTSDEAAVQQLARRAVERFGRIDVWINNAAVTLFGRFEELPMEAYRRVIDVNLLGYIHGARAALPHFRTQGAGVLINNASIVARASQPYTSAYTLTKHAIRGLGMSLRQELVLDNANDIHVCTVMPATIDTPIFQHAGNYSGRAIQAMPPVYPAEQVARTMVKLVEHPRREVQVGRMGRMLNLQQKLAPGLTERLMASMVDRQHLQDRPAPATPGSLFEPMPEWTGVSGGWKQASSGTSAAPMLAAGAVLGLPAVAAWLWSRRARRARGAGRLLRPVAAALPAVGSLLWPVARGIVRARMPIKPRPSSPIERLVEPLASRIR